MFPEEGRSALRRGVIGVELGPPDLANHGVYQKQGRAGRDQKADQWSRAHRLVELAFTMGRQCSRDLNTGNLRLRESIVDVM